ncbi:MAG TPA: RagB/SusD family nutrient uptake outer membrane protein [Parafilimonas sp.]|nr:RagB/SusD family nutrient uptake outer membrane protein [Parafilimonas sp.]
MKILLYAITAICILASFSGCKKYLDKKSSTGVTVPVTLYDLQALLDNSGDMNRQRTPTLGEASADDYFLLQSDYDIQFERDQYLYKWIPYDNYRWPNDWSYAYLPIYNSNYCLEQIEKISIDDENKAAWDNIKGSALFFRAYYFLQLVWTFSKAYDADSAGKDLGVALRLSSDFNVPSVRASVQESYDKILSDARECISYLPQLPVHVFRPSKAAAYGLLARAYLSMRIYDSAYKYADLCMGIKKDLINYNGDADIILPFDDYNSPFKRFNKETLFYTEMCFDANPINIYYAKMDTVLYSSYANNDLRKTAFFTPYNGYQQFKGNYSQDGYVAFTGIATDEMYLIRAECSARAGDKDAALADLNTLLAKRYNASYVPVTANDAAEALNKILVERRKELTFRGLRFIDIKRLNKEGTNIVPTRVVSGVTYTLPPNDNRYALPLPKVVIDQSGMQQNVY